MLDKTQMDMLNEIPSDPSSDATFINKILLAVYAKDGLRGKSVGEAYERIRRSTQLRKIKGK